MASIRVKIRVPAAARWQGGVISLPPGEKDVPEQLARELIRAGLAVKVVKKPSKASRRKAVK